MGGLIVFGTGFFKPKMVCVIHIKGTQDPQVEFTKDSPLKVMTFNVSLGLETINTFSGVVPNKERVDKVADKIRTSGAEVVCLQEVFDSRMARELSEKLKEKYPYQIFNVNPAKVGLNSGLMILSKVPLEEPEFYEHTTTAGTCHLANKGTLVCKAKLKKEGKSVVIANTHLTAFPDKGGKRSKARTQQMNDWRDKFLPEYQVKHEAGEAVVLQCGDFNSSPQNAKVWPEWVDIARNSEELPREDQVPPQGGSQTTYGSVGQNEWIFVDEGESQKASAKATHTTARKIFWGTTMPKFPTSCYDHIFIQGDAKGTVQGQIEIGEDPETKASDHVPVIGTFYKEGS